MPVPCGLRTTCGRQGIEGNDFVAALTSLGLLDSFNDVIPGAAQHYENYLRAISKAVQEQGLPVTMNIEAVSASSSLFRSTSRSCLAVTPADKRMQPFKTLHYGTPLGTNLSVGWFLLGGEKLNDTTSVRGMLGVGGLSHLDMTDLQSLVQCVHQFAVMPAVYSIADQAGYDRNQLSKKTSGFFGA